jgi:hypothetical protein
MTYRRPLALLLLTVATIAAAIATGVAGPARVAWLPEGFTRPILALEFVESPEQFTQIVEQPALSPEGPWVSTLVYHSTLVDLLFIAAYVFLWRSMATRLDLPGFKHIRHIAIAAISVAAIADYVENAGILHGLHADAAPADVIRLAATMKWLALGVVFLALAWGLFKAVSHSRQMFWTGRLVGVAYFAAGLLAVLGAAVRPPLLEYLVWPITAALLLQLPLFAMAAKFRPKSEGGPEFTDKLDDVRACELAYIQRRRAAADGLAEDCATVSNSLVGLSLSGGGIRSATTNLGVLQALSRMGILPAVDYLSTVSGGGYIGSCLTALLSLRAGAQPGSPDPYKYDCRKGLRFTTEWAKFPFNPDLNPSSDDCCAPQAVATPTKDVVAHLRTHGNFLVARHGLLKRDALRAAGHLLTGTVYHVLTTAVIFFVTALLLMGLAHGLEPELHNLIRPPSRPKVTDLATVTPIAGAEPGYVVLQEEVVSIRQAIGDRLSPVWESVKHDARHTELLWAAGVGFAAALVVLAFFIVAVHQERWPGDWGAGETKEDKFDRYLLNTAAVVLGFSLVLVWAFVRRTDNDGYAGWIVQPLLVLTGARVTTFGLYPLIARADSRWLKRSKLWTREFRSLWGSFQAMTTYGIAVTLAFALLPVFAYAAADVGPGMAVSPIVALVVGRALVSRNVQRGADKLKIPTGLLHFLLGAAVAVVIALSIIGFAALAVHFKFDRMTAACGNAFVIAAAIGLIGLAALSLLGDINRISPHYFYRDRLLETYLRTERPCKDKNNRMETFTDTTEMLLTDLQGEDPSAATTPANTAPYMLISAAVNLSGSRDLTRKDRKSGYFVFSKYYCGSRQTGYRSTKTWRGGLTKLSRAITISGAAVSSAMGQNTFFAEAFVTCVFNLRLGYWTSNPRMNLPDRWVFWPRYMLQEIFATTNERRPLINLSDGGHTGDNVGIYPLLERRCQVIIACDAEADAGLSFGSFTEALRHAYVDLGVDVDIDLSMIRPDPQTGYSKSHCAVGRIRYPECPGRPNWLIYLKNSMTGDEPAPVMNYKTTCPAFPHESTADQFFDDAQFESYRALGNHIAEETFGSWVAQEGVADALRNPDR